jgi:polar amino acid transport system ATP-binding protein
MSTASEAPIVRFRDVGKVYDDEGLRVTAVKSVTFDIPGGRFAMIVGPSGSGKTTLLNLIGCIDTPTSGRIEVCGQDIGALGERAVTDFRSRNVAFVFQGFNLLPVLTAYENVEYPLLLLGLRATERRERAMAMLESVGIADQRDHRPNQLSGGQKQRVAIARALAMEPNVMLFDEATSALDPELVGEVLAVIQQLASEGMTMVIVTHEIAFAREVADRLIFMRDGVVVEEGPARQVIDNPQAAATRTFLSHFHRTGALPPANAES